MSTTGIMQNSLNYKIHYTNIEKNPCLNLDVCRMAFNLASHVNIEKEKHRYMWCKEYRKSKELSSFKAARCLKISLILPINTDTRKNISKNKALNIRHCKLKPPRRRKCLK